MLLHLALLLLLLLLLLLCPSPSLLGGGGGSRRRLGFGCQGWPLAGSNMAGVHSKAGCCRCGAGKDLSVTSGGTASLIQEHVAAQAQQPGSCLLVAGLEGCTCFLHRSRRGCAWVNSSFLLVIVGCLPEPRQQPVAAEPVQAGLAVLGGLNSCLDSWCDLRLLQQRNGALISVHLSPEQKVELLQASRVLWPP